MLLMEGSDQVHGEPEKLIADRTKETFRGFQDKFNDPPAALREAELRIGRRLATNLQLLGPILIEAAHEGVVCHRSERKPSDPFVIAARLPADRPGFLQIRLAIQQWSN